MFGLTNPSARRKDAYGGDTAHGSAPAAKHRRDVPVDSPSPSDIDAIAATAGINYIDHAGDLDAFIAAGRNLETEAELDKVTRWAQSQVLGSPAVAKVFPFPADDERGA